MYNIIGHQENVNMAILKDNFASANDHPDDIVFVIADDFADELCVSRGFGEEYIYVNTVERNSDGSVESDHAIQVQQSEIPALIRALQAVQNA